MPQTSWSVSEPLVTAFTLGVRDVAASRRFYVEGLGWPVLWEQAARSPSPSSHRG